MSGINCIMFVGCLLSRIVSSMFACVSLGLNVSCLLFPRGLPIVCLCAFSPRLIVLCLSFGSPGALIVCLYVFL